MSLRSQELLVANAALYVASPTDSAGASAIVEDPANSNNGAQVAAWLTANGQSAPARWESAFVAAVYRNVNLPIDVAASATPEAIWRSAWAQDLLSPVPIRGCLALLVRLTDAGILDEGNVYASSSVGIYCRKHADGRQALLISGNTVIDDGSNDGVVMRFYDLDQPVPTDLTIQFVFVVPKCLRHGYSG